MPVPLVMLKKAAALLLSVLYLVTATGFALNLHFCGETVTAVSIDSPVKAPAGCSDGMKCCSSKHLLVKVKDAHMTQPNALQVKLPVIAAAQFISTYFSFQFIRVAAATFLSGRPPDQPVQGVDLFLKNQVFRI